MANNPKLLSYFETKIKALLSRKVDKIPGKGLSTEDYTTAEKQKLAGIAPGATAITVDSALSNSSTNPVQNKVIKNALDNINPTMIDDALSPTSEDPVQNKVIYNAINEIAKVSYTKTKQSESFSGAFMAMGTQLDANRIMAVIPFPFATNGTDYTITIRVCTLLGITHITPSTVTIDLKMKTGIRIYVPYAGTLRNSYAVYLEMTITY